MRYSGCFALLFVFALNGVTTAQTPEKLYTWSDNTKQDWLIWGYETLGAINPGQWNTATSSGATGDLVVTENATGAGGTTVGGKLWIFDGFDRPRENWNSVKGNLDVTGLQYIEMDIKHNSPTAIVNVTFDMIPYQNNQASTLVTSWSIAPGVNTIRFPLNLLTSRQQGNIRNILVETAPHTSVGNLTWTISEVRSVGTPLAYRDVATFDAGTPDEGLDGAFPFNSSDVLAIVGNGGVLNQTGLSRNAAGTGSLQWTDKGGTGDVDSESGASIGFGNGGGWRNAIPGTPDSGNSYNERMSDFSNYDRMTVRISASDAVNPTGTVAIAAPFIESDPNSPVLLASQNLTTDGQYHDLTFDISSISFLKRVQHYGIDVAPHANNVVFNIDNIRMWNSTVPAGVPGDYNGNGTVDAADYVLWRNGGPLQNEVDTPGTVNAADYTAWRARFGNTAGSGALLSGAIPEPVSLSLFGIVVFGLIAGSRGIRSGKLK